jgi:hypothetical protein
MTEFEPERSLRAAPYPGHEFGWRSTHPTHYILASLGRNHTA